jgi:hypothetical protein
MMQVGIDTDKIRKYTRCQSRLHPRLLDGLDLEFFDLFMGETAREVSAAVVTAREPDLERVTRRVSATAGELEWAASAVWGSKSRLSRFGVGDGIVGWEDGGDNRKCGASIPAGGSTLCSRTMSEGVRGGVG